jgi:ketosteroid isomerase-like protein
MRLQIDSRPQQKTGKEIEMRFFASLLALAALGLATPAFAQDETPAPEEKPSATVEERQAPSAEVSMPAPAKLRKKEAASGDAGTSAQKKETPASASKKSAPAATSAADKGSPESNVKRLEQEWEGAVMKHDVSFLETRVADDYIGCSGRGKKLSKAAMIKEFKSDTDKYSSTKNTGVSVRAFGDNVAVATGTAKEVGKDKDGKAFNRTFAWTDTWMLRNGKWQCIGGQTMLVSAK